MFDRIFTSNGIGGEAIVWLIIAFLWVVAQLVSRAKEKRQPREAERNRPASGGTADRSKQPRAEREGGFDDEIRSFLESLGADVEEDTPPPPPPSRPSQYTHYDASTPQRSQPTHHAPPTPRPVQNEMPRVLQQRSEAMAKPQPPRRPQPQQPRSEPPRPVQRISPVLKDPNIGDIQVDIVEADYASAYEIPAGGFRDERAATFVDPRTLLVNLNALQLPLVRIPVTMMNTTESNSERPEMYSPASLRSALKSQILLSPPLALGEDKSSYTKRIA